MTRDQIIARMAEVKAEIERLAKFPTLSGPQGERFDQLHTEFHDLNEQRRTLERERIGAGVRDGSVTLIPGSPAGDEPSRPERTGTRDAARRLVETAHRSGRLPDHAAENVESLVTTGTRKSSDLATRWTLATGNDAYARAFAAILADPHRGHLMWTPEEADAFRVARELQATEFRAMSLTDAQGGFLVPMHLDPAIMLSSAGSSDPMRQLARVVQITSDTWNGVSSAGATAEWKAEGAEAADGSPALAQPTVPAWAGSAFVPVSMEVFMDAGSFLAEISPVLLDAADQLQAAAFWRGTGVGQPTGLLTGLGAGQKVATTTADTLALSDVLKPQNALPPRFQPGAAWGANLQTINSIGSFETTSGSLRFPEVAQGRLSNRPLHEVSQCDNPGATATAGNDEVIIYGDFRKGYVIADRIGTTVEVIPHLFGTNGRPKGQRGVWLWFRTGGNIVVPEAFRLLTA